MKLGTPMRIFQIFIVCAAITLSSAPASSAEGQRYRVVGKTSETTYFLDVSSIKLRKGHLSAWFLLEDTPAYRGGLSSKQLIAVACDDEEHSVISFTRYRERGGRGAIVESHDSAPHFVAAPPGSISASFIGAICAVNAGTPIDEVRDIWSVYESLAMAEIIYGDLSGAEASHVAPAIW